jgi:metal-dependent hydrolase (beta-lactamase superfamily II)
VHGFAPPTQLEPTAAVLKGLGIRKVGLSHCTGLRAGAYLAKELGATVDFCNVGYRATFA